MMRGAGEGGSRNKAGVWPRDWVALLRSPLNSRSSVAADNPPRNATQVIGPTAVCRSNSFSTAAALSSQVVAPTTSALTLRTRALELTRVARLRSAFADYLKGPVQINRLRSDDKSACFRLLIYDARGW